MVTSTQMRARLVHLQSLGLVFFYPVKSRSAGLAKPEFNRVNLLRISNYAI